MLKYITTDIYNVFRAAEGDGGAQVPSGPASFWFLPRFYNLFFYAFPQPN